LRELTRHRSNLAAKRAQAINELHRTLEGTHVKLTSVATEITGVSATLMLEQLLAGRSDPKALAELAKGRLRQKRVQLEEALQGKVEAHHKLILSQLLVDIDLFDEQIEQRLQQEEQWIQRLDVIPGVNRRVAEVLLAELGTDTGRSGSAERAAAWSGLCPGNRQSGGRRYATRSRKGNRALKGALCQAGQAAGRSRNSYLGAQYRRIASRRGSKRAALAAGPSILKISYHMIARGTEYKDLGPDYFDRRNQDAVKRRLVERWEKLGYQVQVKEPVSTH
jgi:transposase